MPETISLLHTTQTGQPVDLPNIVPHSQTMWRDGMVPLAPEKRKKT